ncbi:hypothetical protein EDC04DRAFT_2092649 [Pisolithus marmoratus]|nr:hypothetical protein EDC04DRAFT_2092649 [Pisolithus marmoratus]
MSTHVRVPFSEEHDMYLMKYLAKYCPGKQGRAGNSVYKDLVENAEGHWPWARHHTWQSWRERYKKNAKYFDPKILRYQQRHGIRSTDSDDERPGTKRIKPPRVVNTSRASDIPRKRVVRDISPEMQQSPAKRPRVAKAYTSAKATETSERRPPSPIPDSTDRKSKSERSDFRIATSRTSSRSDLLHNVRLFRLRDLVP